MKAEVIYAHKTCHALAGLLLPLCLLFGCSSNDTKQQKPQQGADAPGKDVGADEDQRKSDLLESERKNYAERLSHVLRSGEGGGSASAIGDELIIRSNSLELKTAREAFVSGAFSLKSQYALCDMGFRTMRVKSDSLLDTGTTYAIRCQKTAKQALEDKKQLASRRAAVADLISNAFKSNAGWSDTQASFEKNEIVVTAKEMIPAYFTYHYVLATPPTALAEQCELGINGIRARKTTKDVGVFKSYKCESLSK